MKPMNAVPSAIHGANVVLKPSQPVPQFTTVT